VLRRRAANPRTGADPATYRYRADDSRPPTQEVAVILRFADCELDLARVVLCRQGQEVRVEPQVFDVLVYLLRRRGEVVRKEELLDEVWGDRFVSESALTTRIKSVRQAVGDDGNRQAIIRTVHGRGYEFVATVTEVARPGDGVDAARDPLPVAVTGLIGREAVLDRLAGAIAQHRLNTLVGPGGVGKTAVSLEVARRMASTFADGVHVVALVTVGDATATAEAVATAIDVNVRRSSSIDDAIVGLLRSQQCLLVLDNCEHLIEPVAELVARILSEAPTVSILATCREPLAVAGEHVWAIEPLPTVPDDGGPSPAVALFAERARAADPGFTLDETTEPVVTEICRRLDGIPLAIELAAARARTVDVAEIARRLGERFVLLKAMRRGGDPRHRTMRSAISWSYDLLEPDEQQLFTALSVFAGPFDLRDTEAVGGVPDALDVLARLVDRSMVSVRRGPDGTIRYELLETLREYGRTELSDDRAASLFAAHARHFRAEAAVIESTLRTAREPEAMGWAESSFADLRAAQRFALDVGDLDTAFALIGCVREFAMRGMRYEVFAWAEAACRAPGADEHPLAGLLTGIRAYGAWVRGDFDVAIGLARATQELEARLETAPSGLAERVLGNVLPVVGEPDLGYIEAKRQAELAFASDNASRQVHACYMAAVAMSTIGHVEEALDYVERGRRVAATTGSPTDLASVAVAEGFATQHEVATSLDAFALARTHAADAGNRWMHAFAATEAYGLLVHLDDLEQGCAGLASMVDVWFRAGEWSQQWHTMARCVIALQRIGRAELAAATIGAIEVRAMLGVAPMTATLRDDLRATREALSVELGPDQLAELRAEGAAVSGQAIVLQARDALRGLDGA
jgi:predicted ATPase/DNA-binding winged helix-turn-helix (wHTH) protein